MRCSAVWIEISTVPNNQVFVLVRLGHKRFPKLQCHANCPTARMQLIRTPLAQLTQCCSYFCCCHRHCDEVHDRFEWLETVLCLWVYEQVERFQFAACNCMTFATKLNAKLFNSYSAPRNSLSQNFNVSCILQQ